MPDRIDELFRDFVAGRSAALLRTAYLLTGDWANAEDLLQTALTKTYLAWRRLGKIEAVEPYARRVLVTTATSWWRRRWHGERPTGNLPEFSGPDGADEELSDDVDPPVDHPVPAEAGRSLRAPRVRVPRGQLLALQHPQRSTSGRESGR